MAAGLEPRRFVRRFPYAVCACGAVGAAVALDRRVLRTGLLARRAYWASYAVMLAGQLATNGLLAGRGIVRYDEGRLLGPRVACAPVEDLGFGFALVTATMSCWVWAGRRAGPTSPARTRPAGSRERRLRRAGASRR